jgi:hypothetical protein
MLQLGGQDQSLANNEMEENGQDHNDQPDQPNLPVDEQPGGRQKANAGFKQLLHPPELISKLCGPLKKSNVRIVENVRGHFDVPLGTPPIGIETDELRVGMKRAAAQISRSQYEIYSFATRHELSEAATDELLLLVGNVSNRIEVFLMMMLNLK